MKTYVLYHANCLDGFGSALVIWKYYIDQGVNNPPIFIPVSYGQDPPVLEPNLLE